MERYNYDTIKVEVQEKIAITTLNRPEVLNAVNVQMIGELDNFFEEVSKDEEVNVVVLTGAGRCFCAGGDVKDMDAGTMAQTLRRIGRIKPYARMLDVEQPIIAAVNGPAIGMGSCLALFSDMAFMANDAKMGDPHVLRAILASDGSVIYPLMVGLNKAKELLLLGDLVPAEEAERIGLINKAVPPEELMPTVMAVARRLASGPTLAIRGTKLALNKPLRDQLNLVLDAAWYAEAVTMMSEDFKESSRAFLEKREPKYVGR
ncbi:enoyl-CoA hydratase/isomerase family protein [Thermodesulfobacteriota bacterium]